MIDLHNLTKTITRIEKIPQRRPEKRNTEKTCHLTKLDIYKYLSKSDQHPRETNKENMRSPKQLLSLPKKKFKIVSSQKVLTPLILSKSKGDVYRQSPDNGVKEDPQQVILNKTDNTQKIEKVSMPKIDKRFCLTPIMTRDPNRRISAQIPIKITECETKTNKEVMNNIPKSPKPASNTTSKKCLSPLIDNRGGFSFTKTFMRDSLTNFSTQVNIVPSKSISRSQIHSNIIQQLKPECFLPVPSRNVRRSLDLNISSFNFTAETNGTLSELLIEEGRKSVIKSPILDVQHSCDFYLKPKRHDNTMMPNFENVEELHFFYFRFRKSEVMITQKLFTDNLTKDKDNNTDTVMKIEERDFSQV